MNIHFFGSQYSQCSTQFNRPWKCNELLIHLIVVAICNSNLKIWRSFPCMFLCNFVYRQFRPIDGHFAQSASSRLWLT